MSGSAVEFSRLVRLARLGNEPFHQDIEAKDGERAALARRFGLVSLDRLAASVELVREPGGTILLTADFSAVFAQECVVTLDSVAGSIAERFALRYGPLETETDADGDDDPAFEPLAGDVIDIGEAVAQEFSLSLPPFPRAVDAIVDVNPSDSADDGPFAALAHLARRDAS
jgi:uncharacterized metal-binding protein YceD (DUF177 family)